MNTPNLAEYRALCDRATRGPWTETIDRRKYRFFIHAPTGLEIAQIEYLNLSPDNMELNKELVVNSTLMAKSRTIIPELLDYIEQQDKRIAGESE